MTTAPVFQESTATRRRNDLRARPSWRTAKNQLMLGLMGAAVVMVAIPLVAVLWSVIERGAAIAFGHFPDFFTATIPLVSRAPGPGMGPAILGTLLVTGGATLIAVPIGILGAVYLHEYGGTNQLARLVRFMATVMTGVPSVVMGLFVYLIWTLTFGYSAFGGALALACLMLPVVIRSTDEMLKLVPNPLREGSYALGATKARVTVTVVLPAAIGGIVSGALLAVARAAGETAPLLFTILTVTTANPNVFSGANTAIPSQIFANATSPYVGAQGRAWGAALTLIVIAFVLMIVARFVTARFTKFSR
jgi:phosphate transport system permease protein